MNTPLSQTDFRSQSLRLNIILNSIPDIIMEVDDRKIYTWANQHGFEFFGNDVIGKEASYYFAGDQNTYQQVSPVFQGSDDTVYVESWQRRQDGQKRLLAWWSHSLKNDRGEVIGAISTARDITDKVALESSLETSQALMQNIIDLLPVRIFWKDLDLKYLGCNQVFASDAGKKSPQELIGLDDYQMSWKDQADLYRSDDLKVIESGKPKTNYEEPQTTPSGDTIWLNTNKVPLQDKTGKIIGIVGTYLDITGIKRTEAELRAKNEDLEKINATMVNRELKMIELKERIKVLESGGK